MSIYITFGGNCERNDFGQNTPIKITSSKYE